jgi:hypothetical protein
LCDELEHLRIARTLTHPGQLEGELPDDLLNSIHMVAASPAEVIKHRMRAIEIIERKAKELMPEKKREDASAGYTYKQMGCRLHVPLMRFLGKLANIEDPDLPDKVLVGLPVVGEAEESPFFSPFIVPAKLSEEELMANSKSRIDRTLKARSVRTQSWRQTRSSKRLRTRRAKKCI